MRIDQNKLLGTINRKTTPIVGHTSKVQMTGSIGGPQSSTSIVSGDYSTSLLDGIISLKSNREINDLFREIYLMDSISGPAVDLMSNLPWSGFNLSGITDYKISRIFEESLEELDILNLMISCSVSYMVLGTVIGTLLFDEHRGIFTDLLMHNPDECEITPIPISGYDPKIDLTISDTLKKFLKSKDPRDIEAQKEIPSAILNKIAKNSKIELEPINTIYLSRSYVSGIERMSIYTRILPIWLIEKALIRGTIIGAWRRQRSILLVTAGNEEWEATDEQLAQISNMFIQADSDPQGAIICMRPGVETSEVRGGADFWKASDEYDNFSNIKLKALGISEDFLTGGATYNTQEVALSVFMENLRNYREFMTRNILYNKIFLMLSKYHDIRKRTTAELAHNIRYSTTSSHKKSEIDGSQDVIMRKSGRAALIGMKNISSFSDYIIPEVNWLKELKPTADSAIFDMLGNASEKGVPVPLEMLARAAGIDINSVIDSFDSDIAIRKKIKEYQDKMKKEGLSGGGEEEGGGSSEMFSSIAEKLGNVCTDSVPNTEQITSELTVPSNIIPLVNSLNKTPDPSNFIVGKS